MPLTPASPQHVGTMATAAPLTFSTTIVVDYSDQSCVEAQGLPLGPCYTPGALRFSPVGKLLALSYLHHLDEQMRYHS